MVKIVRNCSFSECKFGSFKEWLFNMHYAKLSGFPEVPHPCKYQCQHPELDEDPDFSEKHKFDFVRMKEQLDEFLSSQTNEGK